MNKNIDLIKILVISNNVFSNTKNNGKTLLSFFENFPPQNVAQLYFKNEIPISIDINNYYRITDIDVLKSFFNNKNCGNIVNNNFKVSTANSKNIFSDIIKQSNFLRILRELLWKTNKWKSPKLLKWLDEISPDVIFFAAGDSEFAYDVCAYIQKRYNCKLAVYMGDDYALSRKTFNLGWRLRHYFLSKKMFYIVKKSDVFFTISNKMKLEYKKYFKKDSIIIVNMTNSLKIDTADTRLENDKIVLVYAGGLHYKRYNTLMLLGHAIKKYNNLTTSLRLELNIYSNQVPNYRILKKISINGSSKFCGSLNKNQLKIVLNQANILVHVESFDRSCIEATKLSISTKIPEYLSLEKPIIAIGPFNIASMEYLKESAFCITNEHNIYNELCNFINNKDLQLKYASKAIKQYNEFHEKSFVFQNLKNQIVQLFK